MGIVRAVGRMWKSRVHRNEGVSLSRIWRYVRRSVWSNGSPIYPDAIINEYATRVAILARRPFPLIGTQFTFGVAPLRVSQFYRAPMKIAEKRVPDPRRSDTYAGIR